MDHQKLTKIFESGASNDPFDEILLLATLIQPTFNPYFLRQLHHDIASLFAGTYPGFRASTTQYHDLKHTYSVALATTRLLHGLTCTGQNISIPVLEHALYSAYFHDTGLLIKVSDHAASGAIYTKDHEKRSITVMRRYLTENNLADSLIRGCSAVIKCTDLTLDPKDIVFPTPAAQLAGYVLGSADILAQMADRCYLERLPFLFQEHQDGGLKTHASPLALMQGTPSFYNNIITERLQKAFTNTAQAMQAHFHKRWQTDDLYYANIINNLNYLNKILNICEDKLECLETFLKRTPMP
jgi:hypothetical protein